MSGKPPLVRFVEDLPIEQKILIMKTIAENTLMYVRIDDDRYMVVRPEQIQVSEEDENLMLRAGEVIFIDSPARGG